MKGASSSESSGRRDSLDPGVLRYRLSNGLDVILAPDPRRSSAAVNVWYHVGADHEPKGQKGIAHLAEHLMFEGSAHVGRGEHVRHLRQIGVDLLNAHTGRHRTRYLTAVLPRGLETVLWLEADRMGFLLQGLTKEAFERERAVVIRELRERVDLAPYGLARARLWQELFPATHPYHHRIEGVARDLRELEFEDVRRFIRRWYSPSNATLVVVGSFDPTEVRKMIDRYFGTLPSKSVSSQPRVSKERLESRTVVRHHEPVARRSAVLLGWHAPPAGSKEAVIAAVTSEILASDGQSGALHDRLVKELRLASRVRVILSEQRAQSVFYIQAVARRGVDEASLLAAIDETLIELGRGALDEQEANRALRRFSTRRAALLDGSRGLPEIAERIHQRSRGLLPPSCISPEDLGAEEITRFIRESLDPRKSVAILAIPDGAAR